MASKRNNGPLGLEQSSSTIGSVKQGTMARSDCRPPGVELASGTSRFSHGFASANDYENKFLVFEYGLTQLSADIPLYAACSKAAQALNMWIVARQTNKESLKYIGNPNYCSKSISCKPKTALENASALEGGKQIQSKSAGLVADPTILPKAFAPAKLDNAQKIWREFSKKHLSQSKSMGYEVDMRPGSSHYGCLMKDRKWIHGDLDLFDVIMISRKTGLAKDHKINDPQDLEGEKNSYRDPTRIAGEKINMLVGARMVEHGAQRSFGGFDSEGLDVFSPDGRMFELPTRTHARGWYFRRWPGRDTKKGDGFKL